jgi:hypothetical protein
LTFEFLRIDASVGVYVPRLIASGYLTLLLRTAQCWFKPVRCMGTSSELWYIDWYRTWYQRIN